MKVSRKLCFTTTALVTLALTGGPLVSTSDATDRSVEAADPAEPPRKSGSDAAMIKELQRRLDERDSIILNLAQRVQALERQMAVRASTAARAARGRPGSEPADGAASVAADEPPPPAPQKPPETAQKESGPGQFDVSEEDAKRAIERALVQTGASLLEPGKFELVPSIAYQFTQRARPGQLALTSAGTVLVTEDVSRSTQLEGNVLLRAGLPWEMQAEVGVPYAYKEISAAPRVLGSSLGETDISANGRGDPTFSLTKQLTREGEWLPGLFLSGTWDSDFGQTVNDLALGTGFNEIRTGLTAVKRQDPLVFTAGFAYQTSWQSHDVIPGDQYIPSIGMLLAVSPETSLRFSQQLGFVQPLKVRGTEVQGSDQTVGVFTIGLLSILSRGFVLDFSASIGETEDAPDVAFRLAFPIRLN